MTITESELSHLDAVWVKANVPPRFRDIWRRVLCLSRRQRERLCLAVEQRGSALEWDPDQQPFHSWCRSGARENKAAWHAVACIANAWSATFPASMTDTVYSETEALLDEIEVSAMVKE